MSLLSRLDRGETRSSPTLLHPASAVHLYWRVKGERSDWVLLFDGSAYEKIHTLGALVDAALELEIRDHGHPDISALRQYGDIIPNAEAAKGNVARFNPRGDTSLEMRGIEVPGVEELRAMEEEEVV